MTGAVSLGVRVEIMIKLLARSSVRGSPRVNLGDGVTSR